METIVFEGWKVGMRKIPFIKLLNLKVGLSLKESKRIKDSVVEGETNKIQVDSLDFALEIINEASELGVKCRLQEE